MLINGIKFACNTCVKGHRSSNCNHIERPLFEIPIPCYQCPTTKVLEEQGISYSDLIQTTINNKPKDAAIQCTCHESANKIILQQQQEQHTWHQDTPILPVRPRGMIIDESSGPISYSSSTQPKRRRSSGTKRRHSNNIQEDMQSFLFNKQTELDPESSTTTTTSCTSTPNSFTNPPINFNDQTYENNFMMNTLSHPDELTNLLNNVLSEREQEEYNHTTTNQMMSVDMTRSPTTNSFSSSSSTNAFIVPTIQQQQPIQPMVCGSFTSHSNCSPAIDTQGESVVITITPLSTLFTSDEERLYKNSQGKPVTRIVTCYCGNSCICPGCLVHPNNYLLQQQQQQQLTMQQLHLLQQQQQQQQYSMRQNSSTSSSYSSDDEDHRMNYTTTNYSFL
ncbi:hypothetical protein INT48_004818 [Thamnidium elegans]|uniref:Copper-fist domain-containing protein n=1 Tax=Thamnidium elegans TaxID=101142 RepID=A0A8H7SPD5_9FUNG|nr:hypothetical protein INT48_004818 [Thamnidium elegans]